MRRFFLRKSLTTNAIALMVATVATNAVGLIFWAVAAKLKEPHEVGRAAAIVSAATLIATIAQLNLTNVFLRLVPTAGRLARPFVVKGYAAVCAFALRPGDAVLGHRFERTSHCHWWLPRLGFTCTVALLGIFALQDSVSTSLRLAPWVMVENISFSVSKLALIPSSRCCLEARASSSPGSFPQQLQSR